MTNSDTSAPDRRFLANSLASFIQIGAFVILCYWCYTIVAPFINIIVWSLILSVALYPTHMALSARLGGRAKLAATIVVLIGLVVIVVPAGIATESAIGELQTISTKIEDGTAKIPPAADSVADWPIIGERVHEIWSGCW